MSVFSAQGFRRVQPAGSLTGGWLILPLLLLSIAVLSAGIARLLHWLRWKRVLSGEIEQTLECCRGCPQPPLSVVSTVGCNIWIDASVGAVAWHGLFRAVQHLFNLDGQSCLSDAQITLLFPRFMDEQELNSELEARLVCC